MIIIDEGASGKLIEAIRHLSTPQEQYCIRLYPVRGDAAEAKRCIAAQAQKHLPLSQLYFCEDGEVFLLAPHASIWECRKTMQEIAAALGIHPVEKVGELYDLARETGMLLMMLETKLENRRNAEDALRKHQQALQKREKILGQGGHRSAEQIAAQRGQHREPIMMIIEDDPFSRRLVQNLVQQHYRLTGLASAEHALATYADIAPDLLFLDINLPDVTGHELLEKIVALDPKAYVVMLSGNADRSNIMQAMQHGAAGFVAKPFSRDKLFQYIERCPTISKEKTL